ncbi:unnamed protein product [Rhizophagus irregularis]|nr:unnamed protein product [Rhizophagus irregularis]
MSKTTDRYRSFGFGLRILTSWTSVLNFRTLDDMIGIVFKIFWISFSNVITHDGIGEVLKRNWTLRTRTRRHGLNTTTDYFKDA